MLGAIGCATPSGISASPESGIDALKTCKAYTDDEWHCTHNAMLVAGQELILCDRDLANYAALLDAEKKHGSLDREICVRKLSTWYRQWYITIPLGLAVGFAIGVVAL